MKPQDWMDVVIGAVVCAGLIALLMFLFEAK
jgi:hypothetical protein